MPNYLLWLAAAAEAGAEHANNQSGGHGGGHGGGFLAVDTGLIFWTAVTFFIVFAILAKFAWKPILAALEAREGGIRKAIEEAEQARERAAKQLADYEARLAHAREEAQAITDEAHRDAVKAREKIIQEALHEADTISRRTLTDIELAKAKALEELRQTTAELSLQIAGKVLGRAVSAADHKRLIDETVSQYRGGAGSKAGAN